MHEGELSPTQSILLTKGRGGGTAVAAHYVGRRIIALLPSDMRWRKGTETR